MRRQRPVEHRQANPPKTVKYAASSTAVKNTANLKIWKMVSTRGFSVYIVISLGQCYQKELTIGWIVPVPLSYL
jgi:hypothetical protein